MEPFIPQSFPSANRWVDLCAKGLKIERDRAAAMFAVLCGFGTWDILAYAMESMPPSEPDEALPIEKFIERVKSQLEVLVVGFRIEPGTAILLLAKIPPTSNQNLQPFEHGDDVQISPRLTQAIQIFLTEHARPRPDLSALFDDEEEMDDDDDDDYPGFTPSEHESCRSDALQVLQQDTVPVLWLLILDSLGWELGVFDDLLPDLDEPSFVVRDAQHGEIPVYLGPIARLPDAQVDRPTRILRAACVGSFTLGPYSDSKAILLLNRWPAIRELRDYTYCHLGSIYWSDTREWQDLLFTEDCTSLARLIEVNMLAGKRPSKAGRAELRDAGGNFSSFVTQVLSGLGGGVLCAQKHSQVRVDGWEVVRYVAVSEMDLED